MDGQEPPWTLRWCDESGFSAISSKELKLGDLIVQEYPTTWTPAWHPFTQADIIRIEEDIELLPTGDKVVTCLYPYIPDSDGY